MNKFWMVLNPSNRQPVVQHETKGAAEHEAERLARANPGQEFVVLEAMCVCKSQDVVWEYIT